MSEPAGLNCPGCGQHAALLVGENQAFCGNDACRVLMWDPAQPIAEQMADMGTVDLTGWWDGGAART